MSDTKELKAIKNFVKEYERTKQKNPVSFYGAMRSMYWKFQTIIKES